MIVINLSMGRLDNIKENYRKYLLQSLNSNDEFRFTLNSSFSKFSLLFGIYGLNFCNEIDIIKGKREVWIKKIKDNIFKYYSERKIYNEKIILDKPFMQLLTFSLSALSILKVNNDKEIDNLINHIIPDNFIHYMDISGVKKGKPGTGNLSMFLAICFINNKMKKNIDKWLNYNIKSMNHYGFWGNHMNHLSFQNGYHQYEIFKFLNVTLNKKTKSNAIKHIINCCDDLGHFAPSPGGGACYDYDAVFMLDFLDETKNNEEIIYCFNKLKNTLINEQNSDGGFCESKYIRPFKTFAFLKSLISSKSLSIFFERLKFFILLIRTKNSIIKNHLSSYSRKWNESNLWDSWFRVQTLVIIQKYLNPNSREIGKFIKFPGIGFRKN